MINQFYDFMVAREQIRLKKEKGESWPWTSDEILQTYKFTNVKREHDRTSLHLKERYDTFGQQADPRIALLNCTAFRFFGTTSYADSLGWLHRPDFKKAKRAALNAAKPYTGAYIVSNMNYTCSKVDLIVDVVMRGIWARSKHLVELAHQAHSWQAVICDMIDNLEGFGTSGFMAKEVMLDCMWTSFWLQEPVDYNTWCPIGPGARKGLHHVMGRDLDTTKGVTDQQLQDEMIQVWRHQESCKLPKWFPELCLHDVQFQLCEFAKYEKARLGRGRPRSKYRRPE